MKSLFIVALLLQGVAFAQDRNTPIDIPRLSSAVEIDGLPFEEAWQQIDPLPLTMYQPVYMGQMTERTVIRVAYDDEYLYVAGELYDSEPDKIVANTLYRNRYSGDETFAIILDSFNDNENAKWFFVTPTGVRVDMQVSNDSEGGNSVNRDWNTHWEAAAVITEEGWFAEIKIPFSSLGFREMNDEVIMGMIAYRWLARQSERHIYPAISPEWSRGFSKPSQAQKVRFRGIEYQRPLYITPYLLGGFEQRNLQDPQTNGYSRQTDYVAEPGLDIKYPVTGNMNLDITVNTDFAQVEADEAQVNLSRLPLFFPEKRQFFQERADIFDFNLGGNNSLFYSRRIGLYQGQQVRILGGARLAGRTGMWDLGLLNMQTDRLESAGLPEENFGVLRARRTLFNPTSYAGGILTSRLGFDGSYNIAAGADLLYNYSGNHFLELKFASTFDDRYTGDGGLLEQSAFRVGLDKRTSRGFYYSGSLFRSGDRYLPEMGFTPRFDYSQFDLGLSYGHFNRPESPLRIVTPSLNGSLILRNRDHSVESALLEQPWEFNFKNEATLTLTGSLIYEDLLQPLRFSESAIVEPGTYTFYQIEMSYRMPGSRQLRTGFTGRAGRFFDGNRYTAGVSPAWNVSRHLEVSLDAELNYIRFPERDQSEYLHLVRLRSMIALNTHLSLQVLSQYNHLARQVGTNARFRYNFSEGHDFWMVYSETTNTDTGRMTPVLPRFDNRTFLVKYTYTFY